MDSYREVAGMIELFEQNIRTNDRQSSKGNQLKWENKGIWYKADYTGYEGLAEYMISHLLKKSTLTENEFVCYDLEKIKYGSVIYNGVKSKNFLNEDWQIITLERLFKNFFGESLYKTLYRIPEHKERLHFLVQQVERITGLLSDTTMDYPLSGDTYSLIDNVQSKTICSEFDEQLDISESLYNINLKFHFTKKDVNELLVNAGAYPEEIRNRVETVIFAQMRKYTYLFS